MRIDVEFGSDADSSLRCGVGVDARVDVDIDVNIDDGIDVHIGADVER